MLQTDQPPAKAKPGAGVSKAWLRAMERTAKLTADPALTLGDLFDELGQSFADRPALIGERESLSFAELAARSRQYSRWALGLRLGRGDVVALLIPNRPDYVAAWTGISRTGVTVALLNTNLTGAALAHCIALVGPRHLIVDDALAEALDGAAPHLESQPRAWRLGDGGLLGLSALSSDPLDTASFARQSDTALYIFTSGTTGLPKAAKISHRRIMAWSGWFAGLMDVGPEDRLYNCLPMYHSVGGVAATGAALVNGASVVVREKFSASRFWSDVVATDCTLFQYIGELCRYLLAAPPNPDERRHRLRLVCGNGLREDVWTRFQARFAIPAVLEFYAATEGSFSLFNVEGKPGAIGRTPAFLAHRFPAALVRFDTEAEAPLRAEDGLCQPCAVDEVGEALGRVAKAGEVGAAAFEGYTDRAASDQKLLKDVFEPGDLWFRTGDLMRKDAAGFYYFVDRIGDTFRWKGENVSTSEVTDVLGHCPGVKEAAAYGVALPGTDGRAGMAALVVSEAFELVELARHLEQRLPVFARPLLIRLMTRLPSTETFKLKKQALVREGYDPAGVEDPLFVFDRDAGGYRPLDAEAHADLTQGRLRF
jgi:fatty-acyl-CoA synthase